MMDISNHQTYLCRLDEPIRHDLPEAIDYVLEKRKRRNLHLVAVSKGTTIAFGLLSSMPEYNQKVRMFVAIVPVTYLEEPVLGLQALIALLGHLKKVRQLTA